MKFLAIDTCSDACSVALQHGDSIISEHRVAAQKHGALLLPMIDSIMTQAGLGATDLDALFYGRGPGSFTGLRIGIATAQGIALGAGISVVGVSTLQAIAQSCWREYGDECVGVSIDARMDEVYCCSYKLDEDQLMQPEQDEQICAPEQLPLASCPVWAGSGAERYANLLPSNTPTETPRIRVGHLPNAVDLLTLGAAEVKKGHLLAAELASPVYLRNKVALTTEERSAAK